MLECAQLWEILPFSGAHVAGDGTRGTHQNDGGAYGQQPHLGSGDALRPGNVVFLVGSIITFNDDCAQ
jgi:hypothetical protein